MSYSTKPGLPPMPVSTMLTPTERLRVDAAAEGLYSALHRNHSMKCLQTYGNVVQLPCLSRSQSMDSIVALEWLRWFGNFLVFQRWHS